MTRNRVGEALAGFGFFYQAPPSPCCISRVGACAAYATRPRFARPPVGLLFRGVATFMRWLSIFDASLSCWRRGTLAIGSAAPSVARALRRMAQDDVCTPGPTKRCRGCAVFRIALRPTVLNGLPQSLIFPFTILAAFMLENVLCKQI